MFFGLMLSTARVMDEMGLVEKVDDTMEGKHLTQACDRDDDKPRVSADYCHFSGDPSPVLIAKDRHHLGALMSFRLPEVVTGVSKDGRSLRVYIDTHAGPWVQ